MPTKPNKAGQQQPYVPAGHGDASGEYGEHATGSNKHYASPDDVKRQLGYTLPQEKTDSQTPKELSDKLNGNIQEKTNKKEMETVDYTKNFTEDTKIGGYISNIIRQAEVKITRGSLNKEELGMFNQQIEEMFKDYPNMQKFTKITVTNAKASTQGGYIATYGIGKDKSYDLYINAGWLEKTPGERIRDENIKWYETKINNINKGLAENVYVENSIESVKKDLERYESELKNYKNRPIFNVITKATTREDRLKALLSHELMHRIYQTNVKTPELEQEIRETYRKALENGDAQKISTYATTQMSEFISEANSQIVLGIETPQYIVDIVNKIKGVK